MTTMLLLGLLVNIAVGETSKTTAPTSSPTFSNIVCVNITQRDISANMATAQTTSIPNTTSSPSASPTYSPLDIIVGEYYFNLTTNKYKKPTCNGRDASYIYFTDNVWKIGTMINGTHAPIASCDDETTTNQTSPTDLTECEGAHVSYSQMAEFNYLYKYSIWPGKCEVNECEEKEEEEKEEEALAWYWWVLIGVGVFLVLGLLIALIIFIYHQCCKPNGDGIDQTTETSDDLNITTDADEEQVLILNPEEIDNRLGLEQFQVQDAAHSEMLKAQRQLTMGLQADD